MKNLILALITATAAFALACAYLVKQVEVERGHARTEMNHRLDLQARVNQLERERSLLVREHAGVDPLSTGSQLEARQPTPPDARNTAPPVNKTSAQSPMRGGQHNWRRKMLEDPTGRELLRAQKYAELQAANPDLARDLQLTEEECARLLDLLTDQAMERMELFARQERVPDLKVLNGKHTRELAELLGDEKARQYENPRCCECTVLPTARIIQADPGGATRASTSLFAADAGR